VYLAWKGAGTDLTIYLSKLDANGTWTPQRAVPGVGGTSDAPALAASGKTLYLAWKGQPGDERIFWSTSTDGKTWSPQQLVPGAGGTSAGPALAGSVLGGVYLAWKAETGDQRIFSSNCLDGKTWSPQQLVPGAATSLGPALASDAAGSLNLAWTADNDSILFSTLVGPIVNTLWSPPTVRFGVATNDRPVLLGFTPQGPAPLMLAWKGGSTADIWYGPMNLPAQALDFFLPSFQILNIRSGSIFGTASDTDYVSLGLAIGGQSQPVMTQFVGDKTGGNVPVNLSFANIQVWDTDTMILTYQIVNSSKGDATITALVNAGAALLNAAEKADEIAINELTGIDLTSITPTEAGVLIGAQIGGEIVPIIGSAIGALAGFLVQFLPWGTLWPDCDGLVAAGIHVFKGATLRGVFAANPVGFVLGSADDNPGGNSPGGCGSNSHYVVDWGIRVHA
jgi:hypothetical protein